MNGFTIEELDEIKRCLKYMITGDVTPYSNLTIDLNKKIHLIIDKYQCKHESDGMCCTSEPPQNKCIKCGEFYR